MAPGRSYAERRLTAILTEAYDETDGKYDPCHRRRIGYRTALAEQFAARGNRVVVAGRRRDALDAVVYSQHGIESAVLDIDSTAAIGPFVKELILRRPTLNVVIHSAGIMR